LQSKGSLLKRLLIYIAYSKSSSGSLQRWLLSDARGHPVGEKPKPDVALHTRKSVESACPHPSAVLVMLLVSCSPN